MIQTKKLSNIPIYILLAVTATVIIVMIVSEMRSKPAPGRTETGAYISTNDDLTNFISVIKKNETIIDANFRKETGMLYITIINDGKPKYAMAKYYGRLATVSEAFSVKGVKIVDTNGKQLGVCFL